jgi:hypothetical protein
MMKEAQSWLRERGAVQLQLMVRDGKADALGVHKHLGYQDAHVTVLARWLVDLA